MCPASDNAITGRGCLSFLNRPVNSSEKCIASHKLPPFPHIITFLPFVNALAISCDMLFIKPLDESLLEEINNNYKLIVTIEDNVMAGGAGSAVNEHLIKLNSSSKILNLGLPDQFIEHGDQEQQKILNGLDANGIEKSIKEKLNLI